MTRPVRIGNAHGFWGDRIEAAAEMLAAEPDLDFVTFDFLAEVSMSILALQRSRHPDAGWPRDVLDVIQSLTPYWRQGGTCRMIANAGGLNPVACAKACQKILIESGCGNRSIAVVSGDDVLDQLRVAPPDSPQFRNLDTNEPLSVVAGRLVTANAYLGAKPIADALAGGADIVITGRVADPSLTVGACAHFHNWKWDDWDRLAQATVAGHLIECGAQVTGGISTDWLDVPHAEMVGFPIVEIEESGSFVVTKPAATGGYVTEQTVKEQLVYEIGDPGAYLSPDCAVSFLSLEVREEATDRVRVCGAKGRAPTSSYKVSATYQDGFRAQGQLTIYGDNAVAKARRAGQAVIDRLGARGVTFRESLVECLGSEACHPAGGDPAAIANLRETVLRIAVVTFIDTDPDEHNGAPSGRSHSVIEATAETLIHRKLDLSSKSAPGKPAAASSPPVTLREIAHTRSGDKGRDANIGVIARRPADYDLLCRTVTAARVAAFLGLADASRVIRYELPNLGALNFVVRGILSNSLRIDAQGKTLGQVLLNMPLA